MIEINLIAKKETYKLPTVMGIELSQIPWIKLVISYFLYSHVPSYVEGFFTEQRGVLETQVKDLGSANRKLSSELKKNKNIKQLLDAFQKQIKTLKDKSKYVDKIVKARTNPHMVLREIARSIPEDIWIDELAIGDKRDIVIDGGGSNYKAIGDFIKEMNKSPFFNNALQLKETKTKKELQQGVEVRIEAFKIVGIVDSLGSIK